jgi:secondary thiamine-phosphate synthase enzyme
MITRHRSVSMHLDEGFGHHDVTPDVRAWVTESGVRHGLIAVQLVGSTGGVTTIEYEPGALADLRRAVETLAPADGNYDHNARWGDGNGFSHVRSALLKTGITVPIVDGTVQLGAWQQIVAINFDNRPRERTLVGVIVGD